MRGAEPGAVASEQRTRAVRQEHALVRVQSDGIGALDASERGAPPVGELEEAAVCAVDVEPQLLALRDISDRVQGIDGAGVRRPGRSDHHRRHTTCPAVVGDRVGERLRVHPKLAVARHHAHRVGWEPGDAGRLGHRVVGLVGDVDPPVAQVVEPSGVPSRHDRRQVRQ
jgi:hypothetical protein